MNKFFMQPILDSFKNTSPPKFWSGKVERQGVLIVITPVLFAINTLLIAITRQTDDLINTTMMTLIYIIGNVIVLLFGYFCFKVSINLLEQLLKIVKLDFLIHPLNFNFITFACFLNTIACVVLLYWILSIP